MLLSLLHERTLQAVYEPAFWPREVHFTIAIRCNGTLCAVEGSASDPPTHSCPQGLRPTNSGEVAPFLFGDLTDLTGDEPDPASRTQTDTLRKNAAKHADFWRQIDEAHQATGHSALRAVLAFRAMYATRPPFLREPAGPGDPWAVALVGSPEPVELKGSRGFLFTFRIVPDAPTEGSILVVEDDDIRSYWRKEFARQLSSEEARSRAEGRTGVCLVTGDLCAPLASTHMPTISGVPGSRAGRLVGIDKTDLASCSYGLRSNANSPVAVDAATRYCVALNQLLADDSHTVRFADGVVCAWARQRSDGGSAFARLTTQADPQAIRELLMAPWAGLDRSALAVEPFYSVLLKGNLSRVGVAGWLQTTVARARQNIAQWFGDLDLWGAGPDGAEVEWRTTRWGGAADGAELAPLALRTLAQSLLAAAPPKGAGTKRRDPVLAMCYRLYVCAVDGQAPPVPLLAQALAALRTDLAAHGISVLRTRRLSGSTTVPGVSLFALIKLAVDRSGTKGGPTLGRALCETNDHPYNYGRLLEALRRLQWEAHRREDEEDQQDEGAEGGGKQRSKGLSGPGVVVRYYGRASTAPGGVFPSLLRLHHHHLRMLEQKGDKGKAIAARLDRRIEGIIALLRCEGAAAPEFRRMLSTVEQGRFAIGFYHERTDWFASWASRQTGEPSGQAKHPEEGNDD